MSKSFNRITKEVAASCAAGFYDSEYADYIMEHADPDEVTICNGNSLTAAMEDCYLFDEFVESKATYLWEVGDI